jgi:hypothetical protein
MSKANWELLTFEVPLRATGCVPSLDVGNRVDLAGLPSGEDHPACAKQHCYCAGRLIRRQRTAPCGAGKCEDTMPDYSDRRQLTVMGRLKQKPVLKTDKNAKQYALLEIAVDKFDQDSGEQLPTDWYNVAAYGEVTPQRLAAQYDKGQSVIAVISQTRTQDGVDDDGVPKHSVFNRLQAIGPNSYLQDVTIGNYPKGDRRSQQHESAPELEQAIART